MAVPTEVPSWRLLLLFLTLLAPPPGESVVVLRHHADASKYESDVLPPTTNISATNTAVTACIMVWPGMDVPKTSLENVHKNGPFNILTLGTRTAGGMTPYDLVTVGLKSFKLWLYSGHHWYFDANASHPLNVSVKAEDWNSLCIGLRSTATPGKFQVWISLEERELELPEVFVEADLSHGVKTYLGFLPPYLSFTGLSTALTVRWGADAVPANCSSGVAESILTRDELNIRKISVEDLTEREVCSRELHTVLLDEGPLGYEDFRLICKSLGGRFPFTEMEEEAVTDVMKTVKVSSEEQHVSWAHGEDVIRDGPSARCPVLLKNGSMGQRPCNSDLQSSLCVVPPVLRYTLYGAITNFDREYFLKTLPTGHFYFKGNDTSYISRESSGWVLRSGQHLHKLEQKSWLMGRRPWHLSHFKVNLTFTVCHVFQYSTDNGMCLHENQRCDGRLDSPDHSDEKNCRVEVVTKDDDFGAPVPPYSEDNPGKIFFHISSLKIEKIRAADDKITVGLEAFLSWNVPDVILRSEKHTSFSCEDVWTPILQYISLETNKPRQLIKPDTSSCEAWNLTDITQATSASEDPFMGKMGSGYVRKDFSFIMTFPCHSSLARYPFGNTVCNITIGLFEDTRTNKKVAMDIHHDNHTISKKDDGNLLDYRLDAITVEKLGSAFSLLVHLSGQPEYHLLNSFLPSSLVFLICFSSLWFPVNQFNERIMVSLTSLLVLTTLFSAPADSYIKSPSYRLLSTWFVVLIVLCFVVSICNVTVNAMLLLEVKIQTIRGKAIQLAKKCNLVCQVLISSVFICLLFAYVLIAHDVV